MKKTFCLSAHLPMTLAALALAGTAAHAQEDPEPSWTDGWFVRAGARLLLNAKASVSLSAPPASATMCDNGYVLPDSSGNSGSTWNWGYTAASQVSGNQLNYTRLDNTAAGTLNGGNSDTSLGGEVILGSELVRFDMGDREARLGFEIGYGYNPFSLTYSGIATGNAAYTQTSYDLGGIVPPEAPYSGTYAGPGPLIGTTPSSSTTINSASQSAYSGKLDSSLHNMKLGLWLDVPLSKRFLAGVSVGYSALYADTQLTFTENTTYADGGIPVTGPVTRKIGGRDWNPGGYAELRLSYQITSHIAAYVDGDYQYNGRFNFSGAGRDVELNFTSLFSVGLGASYTF
jgi:hypothetical protein